MNDKNFDNILKLDDKTIKDLEKKQYGIYNHSGVQICTWTKKSLTDKGVCYKEKFYGVDCHRCMQFSPMVMWCQQNCTFCWRPIQYMKNINIEDYKLDVPEDIIKNLKIKRKLLLNGFKGNEKVDILRFNSALKPNHYAISLSGEPTLYPKLNEMVKYLKSLKDTKTIFIVSNGQNFEYFKNLVNNKEFMPTQLYVSIDAPNEVLFNKINKSMLKNGFNNLIRSLEYFSKIKCRRVYRMTQIKGLNDLDEYICEYSNLIEIGKPDIIEVKAYMHIGLSRTRHSKDQMPFFEDVKCFAKKIVDYNKNYEIVADMQESKIVILKRIDSDYGLKI